MTHTWNLCFVRFSKLVHFQVWFTSFWRAFFGLSKRRFQFFVIWDLNFCIVWWYQVWCISWWMNAWSSRFWRINNIDCMTILSWNTFNLVSLDFLMQVSAFFYLEQFLLKVIIYVNTGLIILWGKLESLTKTCELTKEITNLTYQSSDYMFTLL